MLHLWQFWWGFNPNSKTPLFKTFLSEHVHVRVHVDNQHTVNHCTVTDCMLHVLQFHVLQFSLQCGSVGSDSGISGDETVSRDRTNLNAGFLSPLASEKSALNSQQSGFSPSIFLSRPDHSVMSDDQSEVVKGRQSPFSDSDSNHDGGFLGLLSSI